MGKGKELAEAYRKANPHLVPCGKCGSARRFQLVRMPHVTRPLGEFVVIPCVKCHGRPKTKHAATPRRKRANNIPAQFRGMTGSLSKLHQRTRAALNLDALGFVPEQFVAGYRVDDLNRAAKIIVEVNGDYVHANPAKYAATDRIVMEFNRYTAAEKWAADALRTERLRAAGYRVLVAWESDGLDDLRQCLALLLAIPPPVR
jgi:very-short-patch-repair endonuclease